MSDPDKFTAQAEAEKLREHAEDMQLAERIGAVELTQTKKIEARSYWGSVWRRFRRDKLALASGVIILVIFLAAFIGAPIAAHILGPRPERPLHLRHGPDKLLPVGPMTHVDTTDGRARQHLFILGADIDARPRRVPAPAVRRPRLARGRRPGDASRRHRRRRCWARSRATSAAGSTRSSRA